MPEIQPVEQSMAKTVSDEKNPDITIYQNIAYALPKLALYLLIAGPMSVLPGIAVKYFGLSLGAIALAKLVSRIFDGATDPLVGYFSDRFQQRFNTRKPLVFIGGLLVLVTSTFLYIPYGWDAQGSESISFTYFLVFYLAFTLAWTIMSVPYVGWGVDVSSDVKGRSQRFSLLTMMGFAAPMIFFAIPYMPVFETTEVTPETLSYAVYISWILMPLCLYLCLRWVPNSSVSQSNRSVSNMVKQPILNWRARLQMALGLIIKNKPLLIFYIAYSLVGLSYSMSNGLTFFFVDNYLGISDKLPLAFMVSFAVGVPAAWLWGFLAQRIGARKTWVIGVFLCATGIVGAGFISPGQSSFVPYLICKALIGGGYSSCFVAGYIMLANVTDYGKWKFNQECSGFYFSLKGAVIKFNASIGIASGLLIAERMGFDPLEASMTDSAVIALRTAYIVIPLIIFSFAIFAITRIPLNSHQHSILCRRLEEISQRESRVIS